MNSSPSVKVPIKGQVLFSDCVLTLTRGWTSGAPAHRYRDPPHLLSQDTAWLEQSDRRMEEGFGVGTTTRQSRR